MGSKIRAESRIGTVRPRCSRAPPLRPRRWGRTPMLLDREDGDRHASRRPKRRPTSRADTASTSFCGERAVFRACRRVFESYSSTPDKRVSLSLGLMNYASPCRARSKGPERTLLGLPPHPVNGPAHTTLENTEKIRPRPQIVRVIEQSGRAHRRILPNPTNRNTREKTGFSEASGRRKPSETNRPPEVIRGAGSRMEQSGFKPPTGQSFPSVGFQTDRRADLPTLRKHRP